MPAFYGYSEHPGLCVEKGEEDFEDVGLENLSAALKQSAVEALREVSRCGVLHGDVALRNFVRSGRSPDQAL